MKSNYDLQAGHSTQYITKGMELLNSGDKHLALKELRKGANSFLYLLNTSNNPNEMMNAFTQAMNAINLMQETTEQEYLSVMNITSNITNIVRKDLLNFFSITKQAIDYYKNLGDFYLDLATKNDHDKIVLLNTAKSAYKTELWLIVKVS